MKEYNLVSGNLGIPAFRSRLKMAEGDDEAFLMSNAVGVGGSAISSGAIAGAMNAIPALAGAGISAWNNKHQSDVQKELTYNAQQLGVNQALANIWFTDQQNEKLRKWQEQEWTRQFEKTNAYNTPKAQVARLLAAGINPYANFNNTGTAVGSSPTTPIASTGGSPGMAGFSSNYVPNYMNPFTAGAGIAESFKTLAEAKRAGVETSRIEQMLNKELNKLDLENEYQSTRNELLKLFGSKKEQAQIDVMLRQSALMAVHETTETYRGVSERYRAQFAQMREYAKAKLDETEYYIAKNVLDHWEETYYANLNNTYADTGMKKSQTGLNTSLAGVADSQRKLNEQEYTIKSPAQIEAAHAALLLHSSEGKKQIYYSLANELEARWQGSQADKVRALYALRQAVIDQELQPWDNFTDRLGNIADVFGKFAGGVGSLKSAWSFGKMAENGAKSNDLKERIWNDEKFERDNFYNYSESGEYTTPQGRKVKYTRSDRVRKRNPK